MPAETNTLAQAVALIVAASVVVLGARALLRGVVRREEASSAVDVAIEPLAGVYGLLLAFLVTGAADRASQLRTALVTEAQAFHRIEQVAQRLPAASGEPLRSALRRYAVAEAGWRAGREPVARGTTALDDMWLLLIALEPTETHQEFLRSEALDDVRSLREQRGVAARAQHHAYGGLIWLVLGVGTVGVIAVCLSAGLTDPRAPVYLTALTAVITITLFVLYQFSRPLPAASSWLADIVR